MAIKITADSTCDLSPELIKRYDITLMPLYVQKGDGTYRDGVDITPADIFAHVASGGALCKTAAPNISDFTAMFEKFAPEYDAVVHITISADFSSSYQNACVAAEPFKNVYVVDSRNLSTGQGHVVCEAAKMAESGASAPEIVMAMNALAPRVDASFLIDRLDYLYKGGRCSAVAALGANLLHLKPCIEVRDGKMGVAKKYRGSFAKCIADYARERLTKADDIVPGRVFITHTPCTDETIAAAWDTVKQYGKFEEIYETNAGCTVSCHCGPSTLGVLYIHENAI